MSIIGTNIGAYDYMGAAGGAYRFGVAQANYEWIGAVPAMVLSALLFVPYYWKAGVYTVPGLMKVKVVRKPATKSRKGVNPFTGEAWFSKPSQHVMW